MIIFIVETPIPKANNLKVTIGAAELVSCNETQTSETECTETCRSNYPAQRRVMRLKLQKRSEWKFVSRIIPHKQVFNTPQLAVEPVSKACFGVHTSD